jgi:multicomponent Na+:H+ antiporter subunit G
VSAVVTDILLAVVVLGAWVGCIGFARLRSPLDRLHCSTFVNTASGSAITAAAFVADGFSARAGTVLLIAALSLLIGAALSHASGRALLLREPAQGTDE